METETLNQRVFRVIQADLSLYKQWNDAKTEWERIMMQLEIAYKLGVHDAIKTGE